MRKSLPVIIICCLLWTENSLSQDLDKEFKEFMEEIEADAQQTFSRQAKEFQSFTDSINQEYLRHIKENEKEFSGFLKETWKSYPVQAASSPDTSPDPKTYPEHEKQQETMQEIGARPIQEIPHQRQKNIIPLPTIGDTAKDHQQIDLDFFGTDLPFTYDRNISYILKDKFNKDVVADYWDHLCATNFYHVLSQMQGVRGRLNLNDWGYYLLVKRFSEKIHKDHHNSAVALRWFLMIKSYYHVRLAHVQNELVLLMPFEQEVYEKNAIHVDGKKFYVMDFEGEELFTYPNNYEGSLNNLDLSIRYPLNLEDHTQTSRVSFMSQGEEKAFDFEYNRHNVVFYDTYPLTEWDVYLHAPLSPRLRKSLFKSLMPMLSGKTRKEMVTLLFQFVQTGFEYKNDLQHFGTEKFYFPEDMFHYPYSDCEDRALLFARLINELTDLDAVLLDFPGHVAAAVNLPGEASGDHIRFNHKAYTVCDPSYLNAPIGQLIPDYKSEKSKIIAFRTTKAPVKKPLVDDPVQEQNNLDPHNSRQVSMDSDGNTYRTGHFSGELRLQQYHLETSSQTSAAFIAKYDSTETLLWAKKAEGKSNVNSLAITSDPSGNSYVLGIYHEDIFIDDFRLTNRDSVPAYFLLRIDPDGEVSWLKEIPVQPIREQDNSFTALFDTTGNLRFLTTSGQRVLKETFSLETDHSGKNCMVRGPILQPHKLQYTDVSYAEKDEYDIISHFLKAYKNNTTTSSDTLITVCKALLDMLQANGAEFTGDQVNHAINAVLERNDPAENSPYKQLAHIDKITNTGGIIRIKTNDELPVRFDRLKIEHNARFRIFHLQDRIKIEILQGFQIGSEYHWDTVNHIVFRDHSGKIDVDYSNHYNKKLTMKADIL